MCHLFSFLVCRACCSTRGGVLVRARRAYCFVCRQHAMSRVSARRLHAVVLSSPSSRCLHLTLVVCALGRVRSFRFTCYVFCLTSLIRPA
jgi:hypothetical protein